MSQPQDRVFTGQDNKNAVLTSLRQALAAAGRPAPAKPERRQAPQSGPVDVNALAKNLETSGFEVPVCTSREKMAQALARIVAANGVKRAAIWAHPLLERLGVAELLAQAGVAVEQAQQKGDTPGCSCARAATVDMGVCAADALVAATGSVIMRTGTGRPRSTSLLPPVFLAVADPADAVADLHALTDLIVRQQEAFDPSAFFCVTGPSGTGDIEFVLVRGAHGPPTVIALLADFSA